VFQLGRKTIKRQIVGVKEEERPDRLPGKRERAEVTERTKEREGRISRRERK